MRGWIGVDLDGTLAFYDGFKGSDQIGEPIKPMVERVKGWRAAGREVRIFTARVSLEHAQGFERDSQLARKTIEDWCLKHIGEVLPITCMKDFAMVELWDDRCVQVVPNTGEPVGSVA